MFGFRRRGVEATKVKSRCTDIVCKVCKLGRIFEKVYELFERGHLNRWVETEYFCNVCGVAYKYLPLQDLKPDQSGGKIIQETPDTFACLIKLEK